MSDVKMIKPDSAETSSEIQHEVCGWTGTSAARAYAEVSSAAQANTEPKGQVAQATLSAIGDVSVAASEALSRMEAPQEMLWKPILIFAMAVYGFSVALAWPVAEFSSPWVRAVLIPAFPVLCAAAAFWWRQKWKCRAKKWQFHLKVWQETLDSVGYEAINSVNAIRANLIGFRLANPEVPMAEHLDVIEQGARRIDRVIQKAQDPVAWWVEKKNKKKAADTEPTTVGEDTRSRIAL